MEHGILIAIEGTDGSGKHTQSKLLYNRIIAEGKKCKLLSFPVYSSESSALVRMYLNGEFGADPTSVSPYAASTFYAVDRYASFKSDWQQNYENGDIIICDRYTISNVIHQGSKIDNIEERQAYINWLYDLEFNKMGIPKPDSTVYLDLPTEVTLAIQSERNDNKHGGTDIHEGNIEYLKQCRTRTLEIADEQGWKVINCLSADGANIRNYEDIAEEVYTVVCSTL